METRLNAAATLMALTVQTTLTATGAACAAEQVITPDPAASAVAPGQPVAIAVGYRSADPCSDHLAGLGLRLHWDSTRLALLGLSGRYAAGLESQGPAEADSADLDADPATDRFIQVVWADPDGAWPGAGCDPVTLVTANFQALAGLTGTTQVRFSASSTAAGYQLSQTAALIERDTDGDGVPDARDNCPTLANADQLDTDHNGIGDACEFGLTLATAGAGSGTVGGAGRYAVGAAVTLTATADSGSTFAGWSPAPCAASFTMPAKDLTCTATFTGPVLTLAKAGSGSGQVTGTGIGCGTDCTETFNLTNPATRVTLTAVAATGSTFAGWAGCTPPATNPRQCTVAMDAARTVTATFNTTRAGTYALTLHKPGFGLGTVSSSPAGIACGTTCVANIAGGTTVTLNAAPTTGSAFTGWTGCTVNPANPRQCTVVMNAAREVSATFTRPVLTLTKAGSGAGTVTGTGINCGTDCTEAVNLTSPATVVTLTAAPATGSGFGGWTGCTPVPTNPRQCRVTMDQSREVIATFSLNSYPVTTTVTPPGGGTLTCIPNPVAHGANSTCTASANTGYDFSAFSGACRGTSCTLTRVTAAKTVTATFRVRTYPITTTANPPVGGSLTCTPNPVPHGASSTCTATPRTGYVFSGFSGACTGAACLLTGVTAAQAVTAGFTPLTLSIGDSSLDEGQAGTSTLVFPVTLTPAGTRTVTVRYATANGTARAGSDYRAASGTLSFAPGETLKNVAVTLMGDAVPEPDETFVVSLSAPSGAALGNRQALGTIRNDD